MNYPISATLHDKAVVMVFDLTKCIYVAGFATKEGAEHAIPFVKDFVKGYYDVEEEFNVIVMEKA